MSCAPPEPESGSAKNSSGPAAETSSCLAEIVSRLPKDVADACREDDEQAIRLYLAGGHVDATHDTPDLKGRTLLSAACGGGHDTLVHILLTRKASVDTQDGNGATPLMWAAIGGHSKVIQRLLRSGAQLGLRGANGFSALQMAAGHPECVSVVKQHIEAVAAAGAAAVQAVADVPPAQSQAARGVLPLSLIEAAQEGDIGTVVAWLDGHVDATFEDAERNVRSTNMLVYAASRSRSRLVQLLLMRRASLDVQDSEGSTALMAATEHSDQAIAATLRSALSEREDGAAGTFPGTSAGSSSSTDGTPAASARSSKMVVWLWLDGYDVEDVNNLCKQDAPQDDDEGERAGCVLTDELAVAATAGDVAKVAAWLDRGGNVNARLVSPNRSMSGSSLLIFACLRCHTRMLDLLLRRGASVNLQTVTGVSALMIGVVSDNFAFVQRLLQEGAQLEQRDLNGATAMDLAERFERKQHIELLKKSRAVGEPIAGIVEAVREADAALRAACESGKLQSLKDAVAKHEGAAEHSKHVRSQLELARRLRDDLTDQQKKEARLLKKQRQREEKEQKRLQAAEAERQRATAEAEAAVEVEEAAASAETTAVVEEVETAAQLAAVAAAEAAEAEARNATNTRSDALEPEPPEDFICPITQALIEDPVIAADGHTYDRAAITEWLERKPTSPKTGETLPTTAVFPNHLLRRMIREWQDLQRASHTLYTL